MRPNTLSAFVKAATASLFTVAAFSLTGTAHAQVQYPSYSEDFSTGYTVNAQLDTQNGWGSNDTNTGGIYSYNNNTQTGDIGSSDSVTGPVPNFSASATDYVGYLGGFSGVAPGNGASGGPVTLTQALPLPGTTTLSFSTDFLITASAFGPHDNFSINLTGAGGARQIGINFVIPANNNLNADNVTYSTSLSTAGNPQSAAITSIPLGTQRYKLTINVNVTANTFGATLTQETTTGGITGNVLQLVANGTSYGIVGTGGITGLGFGWTLADQSTVAVATNFGTGAGSNFLAHTNPGLNGIYFDNIAVVVPEPSTYALLGLGAIGLVVAVRRSRLTQAA